MISLRCEANTANKSSTMPVASSNATGDSLYCQRPRMCPALPHQRCRLG